MQLATFPDDRTVLFKETADGLTFLMHLSGADIDGLSSD